MNRVVMNDTIWHLLQIDPRSPMLVDRTGRRTVATTDPSTRTVYFAKNLKPEMRWRVLIHELAHVAMSSYGLTPEIASFASPDEIVAEEWICNFMADRGNEIMSIAEQAYRSLWG